MNDLDLKALWQTPPEEERPAIDPEVIESRAADFERTVRRRNALEWVASAIVIVLFGRDAINASTTAELMGNWLVVAAAIGVALYLYLKGRLSVEIDPTSDTRTYVEAHARALDAQARLLASVPLWYLGPLSVGMIVLMVGRMPTDGRPMIVWSVVVSLIVLVFAGIWWLNHRGARKLRDEAAALRAELDSL